MTNKSNVPNNDGGLRTSLATVLAGPFGSSETRLKGSAMPESPALSALDPYPSVYWGELVERDGIAAALELAMSRLTMFAVHQDEEKLWEGFGHLQETQNLLYEIGGAVRRG